MRTKIMVVLLLSIFTYILVEKCSDSNCCTEWKKIKRREEIDVSTRRMTTQSKKFGKELKVEATIDVPLEKILTVIQSGIYTNEWVTMVNNCYNIECNEKNQWISQLNLDLPWPLSKSNLVIHNSLLNKKPDFAHMVFSTTKASILQKEVKPKIGQFHGDWEFVSLNEDSTKVTLIIRWNKINSLSHWFSDIFIVDGIWKSFRNLKNLSEEKYKHRFTSIASIAL